MQTRHIFKSAISLFILGTFAVVGQDTSDRYYQAVRNNDLSSIRVLLKTVDVNMPDKRGTTPLMYAAAFGSVDAMQMLLDAGAEVNAKNAFEATALMWCANDVEKGRLLVAKGANVNARSKQGRTPLLIAASHDGGSEIVKLLLDKGADISVRDGLQRTPLLSATEANDTRSIRLLLEKGADVNAKDTAEVGTTALMNAAAFGNVQVVRMLLAKRADVNAVSPAEGLRVKNGMIALGSFTPLMLAVEFGGPEVVRILLDAGAKVNVKDVRGMTPLMLAIACDHADARVVRLLLEKGADPKMQDRDGQTASDWAKKFNRTPVLQALHISPTKTEAAVLPVQERQPATPTQAVEKSIALLQRSSGTFFTEGGCVACHAQNLAAPAASIARANGIRINATASVEQLKSLSFFWISLDQPLLQRLDPPAGIDITMYSLLHMAGEGLPADRATDAMVHVHRLSTT